ncbi:MAG: helix-turn-helix domain-containing protein [Lachnospiraceae bacterium]|nr:helix-turn-helix domain-containing protein [Lachnospiraceae bacterium]
MKNRREPEQALEAVITEYGKIVGWKYELYRLEDGVRLFGSENCREIAAKAASTAKSGYSEENLRFTDQQGRELCLTTLLPAEQATVHRVYLALFEERIKSLRRAEGETARSREDFLKTVLTQPDGHRRDLRKKLHLTGLKSAHVCLFECRGLSVQVKHLLGHLLPQDKEHLLLLDDHHVILLLTDEDEESCIAKNRMMTEMIEAELMQQTFLAVSDRYPYEDFYRGYLEAVTALRLGRSYYTDRQIIGYRDVAVARILDLLPKAEAVSVAAELLPDQIWQQLHEEDLHTIYMMFANNLNISETARKLYIHRNTMVYRLDRIHKIIGFDIRNFEEAILLRLVLSLQKMV